MHRNKTKEQEAMIQSDSKRRQGYIALAGCYFIWGFQPLYYALETTFDTTFLLACRIIWAAVICTVIIGVQGKIGQLTSIFRDRSILLREIPASVLLLADWSIYLFAVRSGRIMECSMGYYIMPLVMFVFGAVIFREKITKLHLAALIFIIIGIIFSAGGFGGFPYVTILLALCFSVYSALKKALTVDSVVSTTAEIIMMVPAAVIYLLFFNKSGFTISSISFPQRLFLAGSGIVTGLPMVLFAVGVDYLPLTLIGIFQYVSPTLGLICSRIMGEPFTAGKLKSFLFIWAGVIIYMITEISEGKKRKV
ncbi:MAG: EamA family transporter RarD [Eubacteriales bacterium]|nr:EamA family transporter RarD [Eubacteriales bacterium]